MRLGGLVVGAAAGLAASYIARRAERVVRREGLVDWPAVQRIASRRLRAAPGALDPVALRSSQAGYEAAMARIVPALEAHLGRPLPGVVERHEVVDRSGWVAANITTFQLILRKLEPQVIEQLDRHPGIGASFAALANRFLTTQQVGFLLGYLGTRVLGQYDVALLSAEAAPGRLLFVEENVRHAAAQLGVPLDDFRTWIALHETSHAFEFEAHDWLRPYLAQRLERQLASFVEDARAFQADGLLELARRLRRGDGDLLAGLLSDEQRGLLRETQLVMSLLEGFSDWVMDEVGRELLPDVPTLRARFEARRDQRRRGLDRLIGRLIGLDMKLEQYRRGERFVAGVWAAGGQAAIDRLFSGPGALPSEAELAEPPLWVARVLGQPAGSGSS
ncbi:MAG TPA: zinc-dependent metalloprotease [Candidatus Limnocylindrales bacterium]|nr:zinc-dependent metalloprotease [Candidatus Limnocylindrales bacterium]